MPEANTPDAALAAKMAADRMRHDVEKAVDKFRDHVETGLRSFCGNRIIEEWVGRERAKAQAMQRAERAATDIIRAIPLAKISVMAANPHRSDDSSTNPRTVVSDAECTLASDNTASGAQSGGDHSPGLTQEDVIAMDNILEVRCQRRSRVAHVPAYEAVGTFSDTGMIHEELCRSRKSPKVYAVHVCFQ